jgi:hypothetical protein
LDGDRSLCALAQFIIKAVGFDFEHVFNSEKTSKIPIVSKSAIPSSPTWARGTPGDHSVKKTSLSAVVLQPPLCSG